MTVAEQEMRRALELIAKPAPANATLATAYQEIAQGVIAAIDANMTFGFPESMAIWIDPALRRYSHPAESKPAAMDGERRDG